MLNHEALGLERWNLANSRQSCFVGIFLLRTPGIAFRTADATPDTAGPTRDRQRPLLATVKMSSFLYMPLYPVAFTARLFRTVWPPDPVCQRGRCNLVYLSRCPPLTIWNDKCRLVAGGLLAKFIHPVLVYYVYGQCAPLIGNTLQFSWSCWASAAPTNKLFPAAALYLFLAI